MRIGECDEDADGQPRASELQRLCQRKSQEISLGSGSGIQIGYRAEKSVTRCQPVVGSW